MNPFAPVLLLALIPAAALAASKGPTTQHAPSELSAAPRMAQDKPNKESWTYIKEGLNLRGATGVVVEPTAIYRGPDAQFGKISSADQQKYAGIMTTAVTRELAKSSLIGAPGPRTLRLKVTLIGMTPTSGGVATVNRILPIGLVMNTARSINGKKGTFTGTLLYAVELTDGGTGETLVAAVRRSAPNAMDLGSTLSTSDTVKAVGEDLGKHLRERLVTAMLGTPPRK